MALNIADKYIEYYKNILDKYRVPYSEIRLYEATKMASIYLIWERYISWSKGRNLCTDNT
jgi:hypothetical protein